MNGWVESRLKATGWEGNTECEPSGRVGGVARWMDGMGTQMGEIECAGLLQRPTTKVSDGKVDWPQRGSERCLQGNFWCPWCVLQVVRSPD